MELLIVQIGVVTPVSCPVQKPAEIAWFLLDGGILQAHQVFLADLLEGRGSSASFLQNIARANVPWSAVWRGSRCSMDTNRCHRASGCALEARRMAIAVLDELQESVGLGTNRALRAVRGRSVSIR